MKALLLGALLLLPASVAAQQGTDEARRAQLDARRDSLEREVVQKFVARLGRELELSADQQSRTERVLLESGRQRRALMRESGALRARLRRAARADDLPQAEYSRLLSEHEALRAREHDLWRLDQQELARVLTPKQRVQFIVAWAHFQDEMREITMRRMREQGDSARHRDGPPHHPQHDPTAH